MTRSNIIAGVIVALALAIVAAISFDASAAGPPNTLDPVTVTAARTKADHEAIAKAYDREAADLDEKVEMHQRMADAYKYAGKPVFEIQMKHCLALVKDFKAAADETRALAAEHRKIAATLP